MRRRRSKAIGLAALAAGSALAACVLTSPPEDAPPAGTCTTVYVTSNGFHTGLALPAAAASRAGFEAGGAPWVEFGWGEYRAFSAERLSAGPAVAAVLAPGESALHVAPLRDRPDRLYGDAATPVAMSPAGLAALAAELRAETARDGAGAPVTLGPGKVDGALFFRGTTPYRAWRTCNVWTADRLRAAGVAVPRAGSTLAPRLTGWLRPRPGCGGASSGG